MTKRAIAERGYDQTRLIAERLSREINVPYLVGAMKKVRETKKQQVLSQNERKYNLKNAFAISKLDKVKGSTILLVDDVFTTGSSMEECARMLKLANVSEVYVATVATTMPEK